MKTPAPFALRNPVFRWPQGIGVVPFFALAFLPTLLALAFLFPPNALAAIGPIMAGFWAAGSMRETHFHFLPMGTLIAALLLIANLLMSAEGGCCATLK